VGRGKRTPLGHNGFRFASAVSGPVSWPLCRAWCAAVKGERNVLDLIVAMAVSLSVPAPVVGGQAPAVVQLEDQPGWDCATMGNRVCGPVVLLVGDDNGDGVIVEDESGWDCAVMGNRRCG
jgi:hypothetical protein